MSDQVPNQKPRYTYLSPGKNIQQTDEYWDDQQKLWFAVETWDIPYTRDMKIIRRLMTPADQTDPV